MICDSVRLGKHYYQSQVKFCDNYKKYSVLQEYREETASANSAIANLKADEGLHNYKLG